MHYMAFSLFFFFFDSTSAMKVVDLHRFMNRSTFTPDMTDSNA